MNYVLVHGPRAHAEVDKGEHCLVEEEKSDHCKDPINSIMGAPWIIPSLGFHIGQNALNKHLFQHPQLKF